jgi:hypothetical protein
MDGPPHFSLDCDCSGTASVRNEQFPRFSANCDFCDPMQHFRVASVRIIARYLGAMEQHGTFIGVAGIESIPLSRTLRSNLDRAAVVRFGWSR